MSLIDLFLKFASHAPVVGTEVNRLAINHFASSTTPRPRPYSLWSAQESPDPTQPDYISDYTSWPGLTNKRYSARHLPPADPAYIASLVPELPYSYPPNEQLGAATSLFKRGGRITTSRSSLLFTFFAQWFTDSVLRIDPSDRRKNTSNHDIDLCQVYGLSEEAARLLRRLDGTGQLRSQIINGEEYPEYLCEEVAGGYKVRRGFEGLRATAKLTADQVVDKALGDQFKNRKGKLYATGLERGNSSIGYVAVSTIFMREHNRIARVLKQENKSWSDERLFQTARNVNIVLLLKLVVEDYINHILGYPLFKLDPSFAEKEDWYRPNWIALEFDLLYRWHGLCPEKIRVKRPDENDADYADVDANDFRNNNGLLESKGLSAIIDSASRQRAGKIGLGNTPWYLWEAEYNSIKMGRDFRLQPFNAYRKCFGLAPCTSFADLTSDAAVQRKLEQLYGDIERVELVVGLFAEEGDDGALFGDLLTQMVAYDAFTQIFSNPLLSRNVYGPETFTHYGLEVIEKTTTIEALVNRNVATPIRASLSALPSS
jgi:prostaglandin-endoperoxide synthase 2